MSVPSDVENPASEVHAASVAAAGTTGSGAEFVLLHSLSIKGYATAQVAAEIAGLDPATVQVMLAELADSGLCRHLPARDLWQLTPDGRTRHAELLAGVSGEEVAGLRENYERFLELNHTFKELCTRWQTRADGEGGEREDQHLRTSPRARSTWGSALA